MGKETSGQQMTDEWAYDGLHFCVKTEPTA